MRDRSGDLTELKFALKAMENSGKISRPLNVENYDLISDFNGILKRIQIKKAYLRKDNHYGVCVSRKIYDKTTKQYQKRIPYQQNEIDCVAIYCKDDYWFIIPFSEFENHYSCKLSIEKSNSKYSKYLNNWEILK